jgi:hypothetical protein
MKYLTNGDQWKEGHVVIETPVFDRICIFPPLPPQQLSIVLRECTHTVQVKHVPLGKGWYLNGPSLDEILKIVYLLCYAIWPLEILLNI